MNKNQKNFMLEISLNVIFLSLGLFVAFFLLLSANRIHQENLALSKIQNEMMKQSETLNANSPLNALTFDQDGNVSHDQVSYILYFSKNIDENFESINLKLVDAEGQIVTTWDVGVSK